MHKRVHGSRSMSFFYGAVGTFHLKMAVKMSFEVKIAFLLLFYSEMVKLVRFKTHFHSHF